MALPNMPGGDDIIGVGAFTAVLIESSRGIAARKAAPME